MRITIKHATDNDYILAFKWEYPHVRIDSQYGNVPYLSYLEHEYARITANPERSAGIVEDSRGKVALAVNRVAGGDTFWKEKRKLDMRAARNLI